MKHLPWWMILSLPEWISSTKGIFCMYKGRVVEMWPSGYLVLLSTDSEVGWRDSRASMTWPICIISVLCFKVWLHSNGYVLCVCVSVPGLCLVAINIIWVELSWNLRDLVASTGLVILLKLDSNHRFFSPWDPEIWWMTQKNHPAPLLCYFKLFASFRIHWWIQTVVTVRKCQIWVKFHDFLAVWPWNLTDDLEKQ